MQGELENDLKIIGELGKGQLFNLLKYYFEDKTPNKSKKSCEDLSQLNSKLRHIRN